MLTISRASPTHTQLDRLPTLGLEDRLFSHQARNHNASSRSELSFDQQEEPSDTVATPSTSTSSSNATSTNTMGASASSTPPKFSLTGWEWKKIEGVGKLYRLAVGAGRASVWHTYHSAEDFASFDESLKGDRRPKDLPPLPTSPSDGDLKVWLEKVLASPLNPGAVLEEFLTSDHRKAPSDIAPLIGEPHSIEIGGRKINYYEAGPKDSKHTLLAVHALTANAHGFDFLATYGASRGIRVIVPDVAGRGRSDWLSDPTKYDYVTYGPDCVEFIKKLNLKNVDIVGTSMGGLIGIHAAAHPEGRKYVKRVIMNDIAPWSPATSLTRLADYLSKNGTARYETVQEFEDYLRTIYKPFGPLTDVHYRHMADHYHRKADGKLAPHYDPGLYRGFGAGPNGEMDDLDMWDTFDKIDCDVLLLRGVQSDFLNDDTVNRMRKSLGSRTLTKHNFFGIGHAPGLMSEAQMRVVCDYVQDIPAVGNNNYADLGNTEVIMTA